MEESELYYLQSRYYDPEIGRFLNADAFASTGQGLLGNNMFTYCGNNPVMGYDPTGEYTRRQIHDMVLSEIIIYMQSHGRTDLHMEHTTIYYNKNNFRNGWGFCDLYSGSTGEVWELKRVTCSQERAENQLKKYVNGRLKYAKELPLIIGGNLFVGKHEFSVTDSYGTYYITYWQGENGILWYDYQYRLNKKTQIAIASTAAQITITMTVMAVGKYGSGHQHADVIVFDDRDMAA